MPDYLTLLGGRAYSDFRTNALKSRLAASRVRSQYIHYIALQDGQSADNLPEAVKDGLNRLLTYGTECSAQEQAADAHHHRFYVTPRTLSPWSSKATNIAQVCGYGDYVKRIERAMIVDIIAEANFSVVVAADQLHDRMTQTLSESPPILQHIFLEAIPVPARQIRLDAQHGTAHETLRATNRAMGLALDESEIDYLARAYSKDGPVARDPYDVELFMFAQVNSEHCRHKQFNASWNIDGREMPSSLFDMIRTTHATHPRYVISAYSDNAAVVEGTPNGAFFAPVAGTGEYKSISEPVHHVIKVETHNHPTAISPFPGAATGSGGEIRDEGAVGRGSSPQAGLCGFSVSDLNIPSLPQPWERNVGKPHHVASSLQIMLEAPIGSASFNNEFGRPSLTGYFRTFLTDLPLTDGKRELRGYHKPIMIAGGVGTVRPLNSLKDPSIVPSGSYVVVLGGPAMLVGLGGGSASSVTSAEASAELDFASVQRGNAEVQRRAQEVISACAAMGNQSPILFIHDVGAGGLSNALPELCHDAGLGACFELRDIDNAGCGSAMELWCNEAQERYVLAISSTALDTFTAIARRERCKFSVVGKALGRNDGSDRLVLTDRASKDVPMPIDLPMSTLFGKPPKLHRQVKSRQLALPSFDVKLELYMPGLQDGIFGEALSRVLQLPSVGSKKFLITIGDRTVGGLTSRDQLVGPWQVPVADVAVTATCLKLGVQTGAAVAMGEKPILALISPAASARMAIAESLMNLAAADLEDGLERTRLSANWMSPINHPGEGAAIYEAVEAATALCRDIGLSIPVGKDSTSMKMSWTDKATGTGQEVTAPLSLVISAFGISRNICNTWTPQLRRMDEVDIGETVLLMVDLAQGHRALGGSALAQVLQQVGNESPDLRDPSILKDYFDAIDQLHESGIVLAYHDSSDGGIITAICEMMFAGACGVSLMLDQLCSDRASDMIPALFTEELAAIFQVRKKDVPDFKRCFATCGPPPGMIKTIGSIQPSSQSDLTIYHGTSVIYKQARTSLQQMWSKTSFEMQKLRDNPACATEEYACILDIKDPGLSYDLTFKPAEDVLPLTLRLANRLSLTQKPKVAVLREQGVNGAPEMAFAFTSTGFTAVDVHMSDLISGRVSLSDFVGLAACGGFSYGDVLGAGRGWSSSVSLNPKMKHEFKSFFTRPDTFAIGVCNGCQFLTQLAQEDGIIPGTTGWPIFERNKSEQFEARFSMVEVQDNPETPSIFLNEMSGSKLPIAVSHAEGRACFPGASSDKTAAQQLTDNGSVFLRYIDNHLRPTETYPSNPNGSPCGVAGVTSKNGRVLVSMPHFERTLLRGVGSWYPDISHSWGDLGPWSRLFENARRWVG